MVDVDAVVRAVRSVVGDGPIAAVHEPDIRCADQRAVIDAMTPPFGYGYIKELETELAHVCHRQHGIAVSSGTAALHLALLAVGVKPGDEVIIPDMTFIAAANAVTYCGAHPMLAVVDHDGLSGIFAGDPIRRYLENSILHSGGRFSLRTDRRIAAIVVVDLLGVPCDLPKIAALAKSYGIPLIEDSAEALGSTIGGAPCGSFGDVSILSFNNNKIVTSGGGGAVLTNDADIADRVRSLASTSKIASPFFYEHDAVGFNYRMPNLSAALALGQLRRLPELVKRKWGVGLRYMEAFDGMQGVTFMSHHNVGSPNNWLNAISVEHSGRDAAMFALEHVGIPCRALFTPIHNQQPYADAPCIAGTRAGSEFLFDRIVCLPSGPNL